MVAVPAAYGSNVMPKADKLPTEIDEGLPEMPTTQGLRK